MWQGVGGVIELAPGYLPAVYNSIKKAGGLCIADEVQAGFARTGSHFWGFEAHGVVPDIVTMAKVTSLNKGVDRLRITNNKGREGMVSSMSKSTKCLCQVFSSLYFSIL